MTKNDPSNTTNRSQDVSEHFNDSIADVLRNNQIKTEPHVADSLKLDQKRLQRWLEALNPEQHQAVLAPSGPLLILAGAGTGKTRVIVTRIARLIHDGTDPSQILCVTFTNRAAAEMRERLATMLGVSSGWLRSLWVGTFHSLCLRMLRIHPTQSGLTQGFSILDRGDRKTLLGNLLTDIGVDKKEFVKDVDALIAQWQCEVINAETILAQAGHGKSNNVQSIAARIYSTYQQRLQANNAVCFESMITYAVHLLENNPDIRNEYHQKFSDILVDEYQDVNSAQYRWLKALASSSGNICVVGDEDQSIYGWRGARVEHILRFPKDFPGAHAIRLERNYRSTSPILSSANAVIANNTERFVKQLKAQSTGGEPVRVVKCQDSIEEASFLAMACEHLTRQNQHEDTALDGGSTANQTAILVRTWRLSRVIEEALIRHAVPYILVGGVRFYERVEVCNVLAYIRLAVNPHDDTALLRIINTPSRRIGNSLVQKLRDIAHQSGEQPLFQVLFQIADGIGAESFSKAQRTALAGFADLMTQIKKSLNQAPHELISRILSLTEYRKMLEDKYGSDADQRVENLLELQTAAREYPSVNDFIDHVALVTSVDFDETKLGVRLMTLHGAKGMEFDHVFLPAWEFLEFPSQVSAPMNTAQKNREYEEERRLAYVGITRARKKLWISWATRRATFGSWRSQNPSPFIGELLQNDNNAVREESSQTCLRLLSNTNDQLYQKPQDRRQTNPYPTQHTMTSSQLSLQKGAWVKHAKFGIGHVTSVRELHADIIFQESGLQRVEKSSLLTLRKEQQPLIKEGSRVGHSEFGIGHVVMLEGVNARVVFRDHGLKRTAVNDLSQLNS